MAALAEPCADEQFAAAFRALGPGARRGRPPDPGGGGAPQERLAPVLTEVIAALDEWADSGAARGSPRRSAAPGRTWPRRWTTTRLGAAELRAILARGQLAARAAGALAAALARCRCRSTPAWATTAAACAGWPRAVHTRPSRS